MDGSNVEKGTRGRFEIEIEKRGKSAVFLELEIILVYYYKINFNHEARGSNKIDGCRGGEYVGCFFVF